MEAEKMMNTGKMFSALGLILVILASMMAPAYAQGNATVKVDRVWDLLIVTVTSDVDVNAYQVVVHGREKPYVATLSGFMQPTLSVSKGEEHRWFGLTQHGKLGQLIFITESCITINKIQLIQTTTDPDGTIRLKERITVTAPQLPYRTC